MKTKACIDCGCDVAEQDVRSCHQCAANLCEDCYAEGGECADCTQAAMDNASFSGPSLPPSHETVGY